jgi:uncharacterized membrane protein YkgB
MNKVSLTGNLMCLVISTVGLSIVTPELVHYVPAETLLFAVSGMGLIYSLTRLLKCVR